ncbi:MAG: hypothetical protein KAG66_22635, partial [Methylococcales bacterium]|nr:hypothetical protein [Methylococcales bacterium]
KMSVSVSSWCWAEDYYAGIFSLLNMPAKAAHLGYHQVEMNDFMLPPPRFSRIMRPLLQGIHPQLWRYRADNLHRLRAELDQHQVQCICWTINSDFTQPLWKQRPYWRWGIRAAKIVGASKIRIILGGEDKVLTADEVAGVVEKCRHFIDHCTKTAPHLHIVLENHWGISTDIKQHVTIFLAIQATLSPAQQAKFGLCFDPVNMPAENRPAQWQLILPHTTHLHLKSDLTPAEIDTLTHQLQQANYNGDITIECGADKWGKSGIAHCQKLWSIEALGSSLFISDNH